MVSFIKLVAVASVAANTDTFFGQLFPQFELGLQPQTWFGQIWQPSPRQGNGRFDFLNRNSPRLPSPQYGYPAQQHSKYGYGQGGFDINDMLKQVNQVRAEAGVGALRINDKLMAAAHRHSMDQANARQMSHTGSDGSDIATRAMRAKYNYRAIAENVAYNQRTVSEVMAGWINSPGHYANLINPDFQDFGAGMVNYYWTQNFGSSQ